MSDKWFEFGLVRGVLGVSIGIIEALLYAVLVLPLMPVGVSSVMYGMGNTFSGVVGTSIDLTSIGIISAIFGLILGALACGVVYWVGAWAVKTLDIKVSGIQKAIVVGWLGGTILGLPILLILLILLSTAVPPVCTGSTCLYNTLWYMIPGTLLTGILLAYIVEAGMAAITWCVYKLAGWEVPE